MKIVEMLIGAVVFFAIIGLSLLAVVEILFSRSEKKKDVEEGQHHRARDHVP